MFISKKTKAKIRARRKKNPELAKKQKTKHKTGDGDSSSTNSIPNPTEPVKCEPLEHVFIELPKGLSGKNLRKFRKEERRKFRTQDKDGDKALSELHFINEGDEHIVPRPVTDDDGSQADGADPSSSSPPPNPSSSQSTKKRKRAHSFPRINDLLAEARETEIASKKTAKQDSYENSVPPEEKSRYVALDCEMVGIGREGKLSALARVSLTDWSGEVLLDTFVEVPDKVTDFRTFVSGVRAKDIRVGSGRAMELHACRKKVGMLLKDKILVGHALKNDFAALMLTHPKRDVRDTASFTPFMRTSGRGGGKLRPRRLRDLAKEFLGLEIQKEGEEHSSVDDAKATMALYKVVRGRWEKEVEAVLAEKGRRSGKRTK